MGSRASSVIVIGSGGDDRVVLGQKNDVWRMPQPYVWNVVKGQFDGGETLELLDGQLTGGVIGGRAFANGDLVVVGFSGFQQYGEGEFPPQHHAVYWRKPSGGSWSAAQRIQPAASHSEVSAVLAVGTDGGPGDALFAMGWSLVASQRRAVVHRITSAAVETAALPTPGDAGGVALSAIGEGASDVVAVCGWNLRADGRRAPCVWRRNGSEFVHVPLAFPKGATGEIAELASAETNVFDLLANSVSAKGTVQGVVLQFYGGSQEGTGIRRRAPLPPLPGFANSSVRGFLGGSDDGTGIRRPAPVTFGTSFNAAGDPVATVWFRSPSGRWEAIPARALVGSPEYFPLRQLNLSGDAWVGQFLVAPDAAPQATEFLPLGGHSPETLQVVAGRPAGARPLAELVPLWQAGDGREFTVAARRKGAERGATIDVSFGFSSATPEAASASVTARAASSKPGGAGSLEVLLWSPSAQAFQSIGTFAVTDALQTFAPAVPQPPTDWLDATDRRLRMRLAFTAASPGAVALSVDEVSLRE
jgi:hypothetical protein